MLTSKEILIGRNQNPLKGEVSYMMVDKTMSPESMDFPLKILFCMSTIERSDIYAILVFTKSVDSNFCVF